MSCALVHDFTMSDLTQPTVERFTRNLSAIVRFHIFERQQAEAHLDPFRVEDDLLRATETTLAERIEDLEDRLLDERCASQVSSGMNS